MKGVVVLQILLPLSEVQKYNVFGLDCFQIIKNILYKTKIVIRSS